MVKFKGYCQGSIDKIKDISSDGVKNEEKEIKLLPLLKYQQNNRFSDTHGDFVKKSYLKSMSLSPNKEKVLERIRNSHLCW